LEGKLDRPYTESEGQVTYREGFSQPSGREPEVPREGEASKLGLQASPSCPGISACSSMVIVMVLLPHRGVVWHDATVPVVAAVLARWWFTNCPVRCGLAVAFVIFSCPPGGIVAIVRE
jgi:hypothetical protein